VTAPEPGTDARRARPLVGAVLALRVVTELALVAGAAWAASTRPRVVPVAIALGIVAALAVAMVWGIWIAPASRRRLPDPFRLGLEVLLFVVVAAGLLRVGHAPAAGVLAVAGVVTAVAVRFLPAQVRDVEAVRPAPPAAAAGELRRPRGRDRRRPSS
jgi:hypothetical protein